MKKTNYQFLPESLLSLLSLLLDMAAPKMFNKLMLQAKFALLIPLK